ncbi:TPA: hNH endonuclease [Escherichia coli]|nr:hNH endonuclease [Escherichia coli]
MKQMSLIEMDGFLKGKCISRDLKVNETNAEYLVRKFGELESKIALLEVQLKLSEAAERAWESSMMQACGEDGPKSVADKFAELEAKCAALATDNEKAMEAMRQADAAVKLAHEKFSALAAENAGMKSVIEYCINPDNQPEYHDQGMGCGVEDHGYQRDGYSACYYGWESAMERVYSEVIPDAIPETPATDAFLAEVRAQGVEMYADNLDNGADDAERGGFDYAVKFLRSEASSVRLFADQLRKGGNQ